MKEVQPVFKTAALISQNADRTGIISAYFDASAILHVTQHLAIRLIAIPKGEHLMYKFEKSIVINRPQQEVFDYITDPAKGAEWQSGVSSGVWTSDDPPGVGSTFRSSARFLGRKMDSELEITEWDPPNRVSFKVASGPVPAEFTNTLEAQGDGTLLTLTSQAEFGGFFKLAEGLAGRQLEKQFENDLGTLKLMLEEG
jgi:carbon monoxide dehydrogenase subunit G